MVHPAALTTIGAGPVVPINTVHAARRPAIAALPAPPLQTTVRCSHDWPRCVAHAGSSSSSSSSSTETPQQRVLALIDSGASLYSDGAVGEEQAAAVAALVDASTVAAPAPTSLAEGQGTWEVFHAPHIRRLSAALGARFNIRYVLRGEEIVSNVQYTHPLLGEGWLSASGRIEAADAATLVLTFDRFWWDLGADGLRPELGASTGLADAVVGALGRAAFIPSFARFPVEHMDGGSGLAVFRFPPLGTSIAIVRTDSGGGAIP